MFIYIYIHIYIYNKVWSGFVQGEGRQTRLFTCTNPDHIHIHTYTNIQADTYTCNPMIRQFVTRELAPLSLSTKKYPDSHVHKHTCWHILVQSDDWGVRETKTCACTSVSLFKNISRYTRTQTLMPTHTRAIRWSGSSPHENLRVHLFLSYGNMFTYGVATISRLLQIIGLFCQRSL